MRREDGIAIGRQSRRKTIPEKSERSIVLRVFRLQSEVLHVSGPDTMHIIQLVIYYVKSVYLLLSIS
jgi:hypothetical protein